MGDAPDYDDGQALEGEIVVRRHYPGAGYSHSDGWTGPRIQDDDHEDGRGRTRGHKRFGPRSYDESLVKEVIAYTVSHPHAPLREIGERFGLSIETVRRWTREDVDKRSGVVNTPVLRAEAAIELEAAAAEAWKQYDKVKASFRATRTALEALRTVESLVGARSKLMGLNMPVKVDVQLTQLTQEEMELQEMVNEAAARAAASEADIIATASDDPEL